MKLIDMLVVDGLNGWQWPDGVKCITQDNGSSIYKGVAFGYFREPYLKKNIWLAANGTGHADVKVKKYDVIADDWATAIITREQYEAALAAKNDGWIEWGGGECPVHPNDVVDYKMQDGSESSRPERAKDLRWDFCVKTEPYAIVAYRLHQPQEETDADDEADLNECIGQAPETVWNGEGLPPVGCRIEYTCKQTDAGHPAIEAGKWYGGTIIAYYGEGVWTSDNGIRHLSNTIFRPIRSEEYNKRYAAIEALFEILDAGVSTSQNSIDIYYAIAAGKIPGVKLES
jgi:hypothetical protein|nr:MAG TPA: hypothetical protein [Caudoviricetes sp.]